MSRAPVVGHACCALGDCRRCKAFRRGAVFDRDASHEVFVSAVSVWEIAIKHALRKADMPISAAQALAFFQQAGFSLLAVSAAHAVAVEALPAIHADPFDRLLVAQAFHEPLRLLTHDATVAKYGGSIIPV